MNNEPVAYRWQWDDGLEWHYADYYTDRDYFKLEPLYTHQYERPHNTVLVPCDKLTEMQAEIEALKAENSHLKYEISSGAWNLAPLTDEELSKVYEELYINYAGKDFPVDLGRAILKKAQEK